MKLSKYNFFYDTYEDLVIAYNSRTNALAKIEKENYNFLQNSKDGILYFEDKKLEEDLKKGGFILENDINELELLKLVRLQGQYNSSSLGLTLAPTLGCNFNCVYCYEEDHNNFTKMSDEVQDSILKLIKGKGKALNSLNITWYGGEPLLDIDIVQSLSKKIVEYCTKNDIHYSSGIITNGYLLTKENAEILKECKINFIQVTLDGPPEIHNIKRPLAGGQPTFDKILNNLIDVVDIFDNISLRVNVDKQNIDDIDKLYNILKEKNLINKVYYYLGHVQSLNNTYEDNKCLDLETYSKRSNEVFKQKLKDNSRLSYKINYPSLISNYCTADKITSYVIDPQGNLYNCWSDIGIKKYSNGNLLDGIKISKRNLEYKVYDVFEDKQCSNCNILPLCMGGCPKNRLDGIPERCSKYKYLLEDTIKNLANEIENKKKISNI